MNTSSRSVQKNKESCPLLNIVTVLYRLTVQRYSIFNSRCISLLRQTGRHSGGLPHIPFTPDDTVTTAINPKPQKPLGNAALTPVAAQIYSPYTRHIQQHTCVLKALPVQFSSGSKQGHHNNERGVWSASSALTNSTKERQAVFVCFLCAVGAWACACAIKAQ